MSYYMLLDVYESCDIFENLLKNRIEFAFLYNLSNWVA